MLWHYVILTVSGKKLLINDGDLHSWFNESAAVHVAFASERFVLEIQCRQMLKCRIGK